MNDDPFMIPQMHLVHILIAPKQEYNYPMNQPKVSKKQK